MAQMIMISLNLDDEPEGVARRSIAEVFGLDEGAFDFEIRAVNHCPDEDQMEVRYWLR